MRGEDEKPLCVLGRYVVYEAIAAGGMASVHLGRQMGAAGFARTVAIKRLLPEAARNPDVLAMFTDEARLAARVSHPNVVSILDVVSGDAELFLVMEYIVGDSLAALTRGLQKLGERMPPGIAASIVLGVLYGLHAAHEARAEDGTPLNIVHRDVSPQNVIVGADGSARVLDFGIAKAAVQLHTTRDNETRGKLAYMAPEQVRADQVTRFADVYSAGVVLWELLAGQGLFRANNEGALLWRVLEGAVPRLVDVAPHVGEAASAVAATALSREPACRFSSALEMARALERALPPASPGEVGAWVSRVAAETLAARAALVARIERATNPAVAPPPHAAAVAPAQPATPWVEVRPPQQPRAAPRESATRTAPAVRPPLRRRMALPVALGALAVTAAGSAGIWTLRGGMQASARPAESDPAPATEAVGAAPASATRPASDQAVTSAAAPGAATAGSGAEAEATRPGAPNGTPPRVDGQDQAASSGQPDSGTLEARPGAADPRASARGRPRTSAAPARGPNPCDPLYYVDDNGIRRVKRQCLR